MTGIIPENKHRQVLAACVDVPETAPDFHLPLTKVGISGKTVWLKLPGNLGGHIPFKAAIFVDLAADRRGIHMSRIEESISSLHDKEFTSLPQYCLRLGQDILLKQGAAYLSLELCGQMPFLRESRVTGHRSIDTFTAGCEVVFLKTEVKPVVKTVVSAEVYHLTTCPCTQAYNEILFERSDEPWPLATHSQRSKTKLKVETTEGRPTYKDLTAILGSTLHLSQDLLKRPDESELVLKAHLQPQFVEDAVRQVARAAGHHFKSILPSETEIQVHSISQESIHIHDVECCLKTNLKEILALSQPISEE